MLSLIVIKWHIVNVLIIALIASKIDPVFSKPLNAQDDARVKIVSILSIFNCLCLMHANETVTQSLTFKREFGIVNSAAHRS